MSKKRAAQKCPLCNNKFVPANVANAVEHLAQKGVITFYRALQAKGEDEIRTDNPIPCPRCGHARMSTKVTRNALSRHAEIMVCDICGVDESVRVFSDNVLPISSWWCVREILSAAHVPKLVIDNTQAVSGDDTGA